MPLSPSQRRTIEDAQRLARKVLAADVSGAYDSIRGRSDVLKRVPQDILAGFTERCLAVDEGANASWHNRADNPERATDTLNHIAAQLEEVIGRLHDGGDHPDDGDSDPDIQTAVQIVRAVGNLPARLPSSLIEGVLISVFNGDPKAQATWEKRHDNPAQIDGLLKFLAHQIRPLAEELIALTKPSAALPDGMDNTDVANMNDTDWARHKRRVHDANTRR